MKLFSNNRKKRGSIIDAMYVTAIVLALFLGASTAKLIWDNVTEDQTVWNQSTPEATKIINRYDDQYMPLIDNWIVFAVTGAYMGVTILAFFIRGSPVFLPIMIIIISINTVISTFVANAHDTIITSSPLIASTVSQWTMMDALITNLPLISFIYLVGLTVVMLAFGEQV